MRRGSAFRAIGALLASIGLLAALGAGPVSAAVLEDQVQEAAEWWDCAQPEVVTEDCWNGLAQTLTVGRTGQLTALEILIGRSAATAQDLSVEVHAGGPTGALLATSSPVSSADIPVEETDGLDWVAFEFPADMPTVTAGDVIAIVIPIGSNTGVPEPLWVWGIQDGDPYAGGEALEGDAPSTWTPDPEWDFAFATYVAAGEPTCEVVAYIGDAEVSDPVELTVGEILDIGFVDFPPFAAVQVAFTPAVGDPQVEDDQVDGFGETWWAWEALESEIGDWVFSAAVVDSDCQASLDVTIVAAPAPSEAPPTPTGSPGGITLPPTTTAGETPSGSASVLPALLVLGATMAVLVVASRRLSPSAPDRR